MKTYSLVVAIASTLLLSLMTMNASGQEAQFPIVKGFGGIYEIENAVLPESGDEYKIVIDLKTLQRDKESINPGLNNVARMMNLHILGGVNKEDLKVVVAVHGGATDTILNNDGYRRKYDLDNPNIPLIAALIEAGAEIYVCGQSLLSRQYPQNEVNDQVKIGLSMLTVVTTHMNQGYNLLVFD
ncbi:DsrE family protein [Balneola sp. MJW-20]|uniref:DsrE family protein n=1 Tax=Gracilimonas aurantiaca TaxID=3234185 RepID=UPI003465AD2E